MSRTVQSLYRRLVRERLFRVLLPCSSLCLGLLQRQAILNALFGAPSAPLVTALHESTPPSPVCHGLGQREILLGMLLEHPFLVAEAHEQIAFLDFPEPELDGLRRAILEG